MDVQILAKCEMVIGFNAKDEQLECPHAAVFDVQNGHFQLCFPCTRVCLDADVFNKADIRYIG